MTEGVTERLSRLIDGELEPTEMEELEAALESDPSLRREFEGLSRVRRSLRSLAERERPPAALDTLVDPLLRGKPETKSSRLWARWFAAAAVVVLGVTVVLEVRRSQPDPAILNWQEHALEGAAAEPTERFSLAPLPTISAPEDSQPRGAADRLLSAPEPEVNSAVDPAPPLEVLGPLSAVNVSEETRSGRQDFDAQSTTGLEADEATSVSQPQPRTSAASKKSGKRTSISNQGTSETPNRERRQKAGFGDVGTGKTGAQLFVFMEAETAWRGFEPDGPCEAGRYALRIKVEDGVISEVWPVANPPAPTRQVRASQLVLGLEVEGVDDGEYAAEVVIEPRRPPYR